MDEIRTNEFIIRASDVSKRFDQTIVLDRVSLCVRKGEYVALEGPSGVGKTTLCRVIVGLTSFDSGSMEVAGIELHPFGKPLSAYAVELRRRVAFVPQGNTLISWRTILDNITEGPRVILGHSESEANASAQQTLAQLGLAEHSRKFPGELSAGQRQRAALARALVMHPQCLICDEPAANLDPPLVQDMALLMSELHKIGTTLLVVTHQRALVENYATRIERLNVFSRVSDSLSPPDA